MEFIYYVIAFFAFLAIPYFTLLTLAMIWWVARLVKKGANKVWNHLNTPIK